MTADERFEATEIIRRLEGGITRPFLCHASNGKQYVVKGLELPPAERLAEIVCARLARAFGLPIPNHGYIYIDPALLLYSTEWQSKLGPSDSFALEHMPESTELQYSQVSEITEDLQKSVFIFDYWVGNSDRQLGPAGGRVNLLMTKGDSGLMLIDHNQAFKWPVHEDEFMRNHVFGIENRRWRLDMLDKVEYQRRMRETAVWFCSFCSDIPPEWFQDHGGESYQELLTHIEQQLMRFESNNFWGGLQ